MNDRGPGRFDARRVALWGAACVVGAAVLLVAAEMPAFLPLWFRLAVRHASQWAWPPYAAAGVLAVVGVRRCGRIVARLTPRRWADVAARAGGAVSRACGARAERFLRGRAGAVGVVVCAAMFASWAPHYLTWPFWPDAEQFAVGAIGWREGRLPYRDQADFDFPGPLYVCRTAGVLFGWGVTWPYYLFDAALLAGLGVALGAWSRRRFGSVAPGMIGCWMWLSFYLDQNYTVAAQRDWQASCLAAVGLLLLEIWPGRVGRAASALTTALAMAFRPQVVLLLPAVPLAIDAAVRRPGEPLRRTLRPVVGWGVFYAVGLVLAFGPLITEGVFDDFVRRLAITRVGGSYYKTTREASVDILLRDLANPIMKVIFPALFLIAVRGDARLRPTARAWLAALAGVLLYNPISPVHHGYLDQPVILVEAIAAAVVAGWLYAGVDLHAPEVRLAGLAGIVYLGFGGWPMYCAPRASLAALGPLLRGEYPATTPPGASRGRWFPNEPGSLFARYRWADYVRCLDHLKRTTTLHTPVADLLGAFPYPVVNGPTGRPTPFPAAGGLFHLAEVNPALEDAYLQALDHPDVRVVWVPGKIESPHEFRSERLRKYVAKHYRPEARFGVIEVWRRSPVDAADFTTRADGD